MKNEIVMVNKKCSACGQVKSINDFWKRVRAKDGYNSSCIHCVRTQNSNSYKNHWLKNRKRIDANNYLITEQLREKCNLIKHNMGCYFCKENNPVCLDFHHKNKNSKTLGISSMIGRHRVWATIENEISKCIVVCANCHRKIHAGELNYSLE